MYSEEEVRIFSAPSRPFHSMEGNFFGYKLSLLNGLHPCSMQSFDGLYRARWLVPFHGARRGEVRARQ
jgi:hypothetical protein